MDIAVISDVTGLTAQEIECLWAEPVRSAREIKGMFMARLREYEERFKDEGREEGRWDGRQEGLREGREHGRLEGLLDGRKECARAMRNRGIDGAVIAEITGLLIEEIEAL